MSRRWPILGRSGEVDTVLALLHQAAAGGATRGVVLHGPAGIGKTSVARQLADAAIEAGYVTEWLTAPSAAGAPLVWLAPLRQPGSTVRTRSDLLHELEQVIRERSPHQPLFTVIDDAPGLDEADLDLLAHLARRRLVFVVATARGSSSRPAIFRPSIVDGTFEAIEVMPLSDVEIVDAAEHFLGGTLDPAAARAVATAAGGVPLFAREYVAANVGSAALTSDGDVWRFTAPPGVPPTLIELVNARSEDVTAEQRSFLDVLAMVQPLPSSLLAIDELAALEDMGLIATDVGDHDSIRFAHPLFAEAVTARHGPLRRRAVAERALAVIEQLPMSDPDRELRIAVHCLAHDFAMSDELAVAAARQALNAVDPGLARRLIERLDHATWDSQFVLGAALAVSGDTAAADAALIVATELADTDEHRARAASRRANSLGTGGARFADAMQVLDDAKAAISDPHWRAFLDADRAYLQLALGVPADVAIADGDTTGVARANECLVGAVIAALAGRGSETEALVEEGLSLAHLLVADVPTARELLNLSRVIWLATAGRADDARATVDAELERSAGRSAIAGSWLTMRSLDRLLDGDALQAAGTAGHAAAELDDVDISLLRPFTLGIQATALAQMNRPADARRVLDQVDENWRSETKARLMAELAEAWMLVMAGRSQAAARRCAAAARAAYDAQHAPLAMFAAHDAARFGHPSVALPVLVDAASTVEGDLIPALVAHARALDDADTDTLLELAGQLPALGFTISGAECAATAGRLLDARRKPQAAIEARRLAAQLIEPLGDVRTPGLGALVVLSARERQVGEMAAARHRNREIAEALGISVRTVDNHLASLYRKLGVASRDELRSLL
jgi:DNA-binding CsgD family transcriptional regulator